MDRDKCRLELNAVEGGLQEASGHAGKAVDSCKGQAGVFVALEDLVLLRWTDSLAQRLETLRAEVAGVLPGLRPKGR